MCTASNTVCPRESVPPKRHLDQFIHFCRVHDCVQPPNILHSTMFINGSDTQANMPFPHGGIWTPSTWFLGLTSHTNPHLKPTHLQFGRFCRAHNGVQTHRHLHRQTTPLLLWPHLRYACLRTINDTYCEHALHSKRGVLQHFVQLTSCSCILFQ